MWLQCSMCISYNLQQNVSNKMVWDIWGMFNCCHNGSTLLFPHSWSVLSGLKAVWRPGSPVFYRLLNNLFTQSSALPTLRSTTPTSTCSSFWTRCLLRYLRKQTHKIINKLCKRKLMLSKTSVLRYYMVLANVLVSSVLTFDILLRATRQSRH